MVKNLWFNGSVIVSGFRVIDTRSLNTIQYCAQTAPVHNPLNCDGKTETLDRRSLFKERAVNTGIYIIRNLVNGKCYIGSSFNMRKRKNQHFHFLRKGQHHSGHLQHAFNKYGETAFQFSVLMYCEKNEKIRYEQAFIDLYNPEYNISPTASNTTGVKRSEEYKHKMRILKTGIKMSQEARNRNRLAQLGKKLSDDHKKRISESNTGKKRSEEVRKKQSESAKKRKPFSEETRARMSASQKKRVFTEEHKQNLSRAGMGHVVSEETRRKISETKVREHAGI